MSHFPAVTAKEVVKVLQKAGFYEHHQKGSHKIFKRDFDQRRVVVPFHSGKIIPRKTLRSILLDAEINLEKFRELP
jgi:predicted RNA binding protein YcfA (HicA-like mRNA interferase family)